MLPHPPAETINKLVNLSSLICLPNLLMDRHERPLIAGFTQSFEMLLAVNAGSEWEPDALALVWCL